MNRVLFFVFIKVWRVSELRWLITGWFFCFSYTSQFIEQVRRKLQLRAEKQPERTSWWEGETCGTYFGSWKKPFFLSNWALTSYVRPAAVSVRGNKSFQQPDNKKHLQLEFWKQRYPYNLFLIFSTYDLIMAGNRAYFTTTNPIPANLISPTHCDRIKQPLTLSWH